MKYFRRVEVVDNPHLEESFKVFKSIGEVKPYAAIDSMVLSARVYLENALTQAIIQSVNAHCNQQTITMKALTDLDLTDKVVYTDPISYQYLVGNKTLSKAKYVIATKHPDMDDRVIVLDLGSVDHGAILDYSFDALDPAKLASDVDVEAILKVQFYVESKSGVDYKCTYPDP